MDEKNLIEQAGKGDEAAFEILVQRYEKTVYNLCLRITRDREESFDLSQETFLKAWHAISLFQGESKFCTWLCRIASNNCVDYLRKQKKQKNLSIMSLDDEEVAYEQQIADTQFDPAVMLERSGDRELVRQAFQSLPTQDRMILSLRAVEDMSYDEIGQVLNLKSGTVKSRIARAREKIRRRFYGNFLSENPSNKGKEGVKS